MRGQFVWKSVAELPRLGSAWVSMEECGTSMSMMYGCYHLLYIYIYLCYMHFEPPKYGKYQIFLKFFKGETSKKVESRQFVVTQLKSHSLNRKK